MKFRSPFIREKVIKHADSRIVSNSFGQGESPEVPFATLIHYHDCTPQIQIGVTSYAELITGTEIQVNSENEQAKKICEDFNRDTNLYDKFEGLVNTLLITGNAILEKLDENTLEDIIEVDMSTIIKKNRDEFGNLISYEQMTDSGTTVKLGEGKLNKFIEFNLSSYSRNPWGKSLFYALAKQRTVGNRTLKPLVEIMWAVEDAMSAIIVNNAYPIRTITLEGANDAELEKEANKWKRYKPGDTIIQSRKLDIEHFETQSNSKYTDYIQHLEKAIELGIKFPHDIMTGDFTSRASSETTENIVLKLARGFQRYLANKLKQEIYEPILIKNGINPEEANLNVSFTTQDIIKLDTTTVNFFVQSGVITRDEAREWLIDNTGIDLFDDSTVDLIPVSRFGDGQLPASRQTNEKILKKISTQQKTIDQLKERLTIRETADKAGKIKLTKEILKELKNL